MDDLLRNAAAARRAARGAIASTRAGANATDDSLTAWEPPAVLSADGVTTVVLTWQQIEADEPVGGGISCSALQLYGSSCLLRLAAGSAQFEEDRASVHLITPGDALVSQTGAALGVCLLRPDAEGEGVCPLELYVDASTGSVGERYASSLLLQAEREAARRKQQWLVSRVGTSRQRSAGWLCAAGFGQAPAEGGPASCREDRDLVKGVACAWMISRP